MIDEKDIKVGNFVTSTEVVFVNDIKDGVDIYMHKLSCEHMYYSTSRERMIFKIISTNSGICVKPVVPIKSFYNIDREIKCFCIPRQMFMETFTILKAYYDESFDETYDIENQNTKESESSEQVNHPSHYSWLKELCGVEPLDICRHLNFNVGNAIKYLLRKDKVERNLTEEEQRIQDLEKAIYYLKDEIDLIKNGGNNKDNK